MWPKPAVALLLGLLLTSGACVGCQQRTANEASVESDPDQEVIVEEIQFRHQDHVLAGSLYRPNRAGRRPAVALVFGSGAQDRRYGGTGPALGRHFARHGFVCLAWDKPGVGKSTGDFNAQTFQDRAGETLAAVRFLRERPEVRADAVGLWGHSQGGMVVPLAASLSKDVSFAIQVSGWQGGAWRQDAVRVEAELRAAGLREADVKEGVAFAQMRMGLIRGTGPFEELEAAQAKVKTRPWFVAVRACDRTLFYTARRQVNHDSGPSWEKVYCPVLVIYGDKDTSSGPPEPLVAIIRTGLAKAKNADATVRIFAGADHSLCVPNTGRTNELPRGAKGPNDRHDPAFADGYLDTMTDWLGARFPSGSVMGEPDPDPE
jgi:pimeloyl-ACP methyl ester carboxylesterase